MALFILPWAYVPDPTEGRPIFNGKIYFGIAGQNAMEFPKDVEIVQENGSSMIAAQPIRTNVGGTPTYNGSPVSINLLDGDYSVMILDANDNQRYEYASLVATDNNVTENALRAAALRLNLDATLIGTVLITNDGGNSLDDAEYLLDTITGFIYSLPDNIPAGSTVVSSSGTTLVTSNGQFEMTHVWFPVENRFKGNQNWNVEGSTGAPLPTSVDYTYSPTDEIAAGRFCLVELVNATYDAGLFDADSGSYYIEYEGDFTSDYYGVKLADGSVTKTGCTISLEGSNTRITVDVGAVGPHKFPGFSESVGSWPDVSDDESIEALYSKLLISRSIIDQTSSRISGATYTNESKVDRYVCVTSTSATASGKELIFNVDGVNVNQDRNSSLDSNRISVAFTVPSESEYTITANNSSILTWMEY